MDEDEKANSTILRYSVLAGVADITPIVGADLAVVLAFQLKMYVSRISTASASLQHGSGKWWSHWLEASAVGG